MAEVRWSARRISDGVLVDVTGDTAGTPAGAPTQNALEAGGIAAADKQIVYMDGANAVGSANLTWTEDGDILGIAAVENGTGTIRCIGVGAQLVIQAANGDATHVGGEVQIASGNSNGQGSGAVTLTSGDDAGAGDSGALTLSTGVSVGAASGNIDIRPGGTSATGGSINIVAATGQTGSGGNVIVQAGAKVTGGSHGSVQLYSGDGNQSLELGTAGVIHSGKIGFFGATPAAQAAANPDTSGATLAALETEVNELKALLRTYGLLAT